jgi:hypothetical protein
MGEIIVRAPTLDDAHSVAGLIAERDRVDFGAVDGITFTGDELREWWGSTRRAWRPTRGSPCAGATSSPTHASSPSVIWRTSRTSRVCARTPAGSGSVWELLDRVERWARERSLARVQIHVAGDDGRRLAEDRGHELVRRFWQMEIELEAEPAVPALPAGLKNPRLSSLRRRQGAPRRTPERLRGALGVHTETARRLAQGAARTVGLPLVALAARRGWGRDRGRGALLRSA